jgi:hypothetical protein
MVARLTPNVRRILFGENGNAPLGLPKFYVCYWTPATNETPNITPEYFDENQSEFETLFDTVKKGLKSANEVQLSGDANNTVKAADKAQEQQIASGGTGATNNQNTTTVSGPICLPPSITSFTPLTGVTGTIVNIIGNDLGSVTAVTINGVTVTTGITINSETNVVVIVPFSNTTIAQNNVITVKGVYGDGSSTTTFTYNPLQTTAAPPTIAPLVPPNSNTNPQQTGPVIMIQVTSYNNDNLTVIINPEYYPTGNTALSPWNFQYTEQDTTLDYQFVRLSATSNNQYVQVILGQGTLTQDLDSYFVNEIKFQIDSSSIVSDFDNQNIDIPPGTTKILCKFGLTAQRVDQPNIGQEATQWFPFSFAI